MGGQYAEPWRATAHPTPQARQWRPDALALVSLHLALLLFDQQLLQDVLPKNNGALRPARR
jgi:hypothetical protein